MQDKLRKKSLTSNAGRLFNARSVRLLQANSKFDEKITFVNHRLTEFCFTLGANDPVRLSRKLGLKRNSIPKADGNEMVQADVLAWSKPFRHRLNTLAVTGAYEPRDVKRAHLSPLLVPELVQKWLQNAESSVSRSAMSRALPESAKVVLLYGPLFVKSLSTKI